MSAELLRAIARSLNVDYVVALDEDLRYHVYNRSNDEYRIETITILTALPPSARTAFCALLEGRCECTIDEKKWRCDIRGCSREEG